MTTFAPLFFSKYLPSVSSADLASWRSEKSSKSKNASSIERRSLDVSVGGGGAFSSEGGAGGVDSVGGGSICAAELTFFREEQPGARASTTASPIRATEANRGFRLIMCLPSGSGGWIPTTSTFSATYHRPPGNVNPARNGPSRPPKDR